VQLVADRLEQVSTQTRCVIVTIDHNVKPPRDGSSMRSSMHDVHGTTAKTETAQSHFVFAGEEDKSMTHVEHKKERVHGHTVAPFALRFDDISDERDPRWDSASSTWTGLSRARSPRHEPRSSSRSWPKTCAATSRPTRALPGPTTSLPKWADAFPSSEWPSMT
jgi:hypothetical protein